MIAIAVYNESINCTDAEAQAACAAIQRQVVEHFEPIWAVTGVVSFYKKGEAAPAGAWIFTLQDGLDTAGALGYHTVEGNPRARIDVQACIADGIAWSSCLSHEILEALADPETIRCVDVGGAVMALEVCDACEASKEIDGSDYQIDGVVLENFVTPDWFVRDSNGPWDYLGVLSGPLTRTSGGYDVSAQLGQWVQRTGATTRPGKRRARPGSRREARGVL